MKRKNQITVLLFFFVSILSAGGRSFLTGADKGTEKQMPGTHLLTLEGDVASYLVDGVDRFLLKELEKSIANRARYWHRDFSSADAYNKSISENRKRLAHILGVRDPRIPFREPEWVGTTKEPALVAGAKTYSVYAIRWPAFGDVTGEGLMLVPKKEGTLANVIAIPDADQTPEMVAGLMEGVPAESQYARRLAESGFRVFVPTLINRQIQERPRPGSSGGSRLSNREFLYRSAYELGRTLVGYEVQKVLALVDWLTRGAAVSKAKVGVVGWGEGGLLSLYAGALDERIDAVMVSGYFDTRQNLWQEPIERNVFGLLEQFGDAELASMVVPRPLVIEAAKGPEVIVPPGLGGAPGRLVTPKLEDVIHEVDRAKQLVQGFESSAQIHFMVSGEGKGPYGTTKALETFSGFLSPGVKIPERNKPPTFNLKSFDPSIRHLRQMHEIDRHSQWLLRESEYVRKEFMKNLNTESLENHGKTVEWYRRFFDDEVIGRFDMNKMPPGVRSRMVYDKEKWTGYEVVMDVFPDVIAYGILLLPKDLKKGERRPVVVCQHGLEGRAQDVIEGDKGAYHDFAAKLAERGFIAYAPQNLYIFTDRFRTLQRKGNPIKKTLYSVIVPQHQQVVDWLASLPYVDPDRIAFYGLSYGGKTAMRVPALVTTYCLSICSADFNEWVWKNASTRSPYSYVWSGEYEIFEFDLGSTFNYTEMAALIAPRPFMVERGMFDGVAPDETVAYEFAKVRHLYAAELKLDDRCEIEFFVGPHTIHGKGTFDFLHKHLNWPK